MSARSARAASSSSAGSGRLGPEPTARPGPGRAQRLGIGPQGRAHRLRSAPGDSGPCRRMGRTGPRARSGSVADGWPGRRLLGGASRPRTAAPLTPAMPARRTRPRPAEQRSGRLPGHRARRPASTSSAGSPGRSRRAARRPGRGRVPPGGGPRSSARSRPSPRSRSPGPGCPRGRSRSRPRPPRRPRSRHRSASGPRPGRAGPRHRARPVRRSSRARPGRGPGRPVRRWIAASRSSSGRSAARAEAAAGRQPLQGPRGLGDPGARPMLRTRAAARLDRCRARRPAPRQTSSSGCPGLRRRRPSSSGTQAQGALELLAVARRRDDGHPQQLVAEQRRGPPAGRRRGRRPRSARAPPRGSGPARGAPPGRPSHEATWRESSIRSSSPPDR